jgi:hypothetical protein
VSRKGSWRVVEKGVNGKPFLWKKAASASYVMIEIFKARPRDCYTVLALDANPLARPDVKGRIIGIGCAAARTDWIEAYGKARKIADQYMNKH